MHQVIFTMVIVAGELFLVVIGLGVDPPVIERDPEVVITSSGQQTGKLLKLLKHVNNLTQLYWYCYWHTIPYYCWLYHLGFDDNGISR